MLTAGLLVLALCEPIAVSAGAPPRLKDLLASAGRYVTSLQENLAVLVANEDYTQAEVVDRRGKLGLRRSLASDVAWVPSDDPFVWAFFRDVREVDGDPVRDREERLASLFPSGVTAAGTRRARQILQESARYNLGLYRTINSPTVALSFLHPHNQPRFAFDVKSHGEREGTATWSVRFKERARPTLTRTSEGEDVPARGLLWLEAGSAALVESRLEFHPTDRSPIVIETVYARDDRLGGWLPKEMRESYGDAADRLAAVARYARWRRAQVEMKVILPDR